MKKQTKFNYLITKPIISSVTGIGAFHIYASLGIFPLNFNLLVGMYTSALMMFILGFLWDNKEVEKSGLIEK